MYCERERGEKRANPLGGSCWPAWGSDESCFPPYTRNPQNPKKTQSRRLFARLLAVPAVAASRCLSVYLSMPSKEVPTYPDLVGELFRAGGGGRAVYVPKVRERVITPPPPVPSTNLPLDLCPTNPPHNKNR